MTRTTALRDSVGSPRTSRVATAAYDEWPCASPNAPGTRPRRARPRCAATLPSRKAALVHSGSCDSSRASRGPRPSRGSRSGGPVGLPVPIGSEIQTPRTCRRDTDLGRGSPGNRGTNGQPRGASVHYAVAAGKALNRRAPAWDVSCAVTPTGVPAVHITAQIGSVRDPDSHNVGYRPVEPF